MLLSNKARHIGSCITSMSNSWNSWNYLNRQRFVLRVRRSINGIGKKEDGLSTMSYRLCIMHSSHISKILPAILFCSIQFWLLQCDDHTYIFLQWKMFRIFRGRELNYHKKTIRCVDSKNRENIDLTAQLFFNAIYLKYL